MDLRKAVNPPADSICLSKLEAAAHLRISPRWLEVLTREGKIPAVPLSDGERKRYIYSRKVLEEWAMGKSQKKGAE